MTALTRGYLAEKTSEAWAQPMRRWTDTFAPARRAILIDQTPEHDKLVRDIHEAQATAAREAHEAEVAEAREALEARKELISRIPPSVNDPQERGARSHRRSRRHK